MRQIRLEDVVKARCPYVEVKEFAHGVEFIRCQCRNVLEVSGDRLCFLNVQNHICPFMQQLSATRWQMNFDKPEVSRDELRYRQKQNRESNLGV